MKIIHIADTHLGRVAFNKTTETGSNLRESLIYDNFVASIERIIDEDPDVVIHAGDLFDAVKPKTKALLVAMQALKMLKDANIPFIAVAGNHSMQKNAYTSSIFEVLQKAHPEAHLAYSFKYENVKIGDTLFHLIPNMLHADDYKKAAMDASAYNRENRYCDKCNHVLVTHGLASTIADKKLSAVAEFELTPAVLSGTYDYIALGHYHGQMQVAPNAWYSGSIEHLTYGEIADKKGGLIVDCEEKTVKNLPLPHSSMDDLGVIDCSDMNMEIVINDITCRYEKILHANDQMIQITLDYGNAPIKTIPSDALKDIRDNTLDLKIRVRSVETERAIIQQQDLHAVNYVDEWSKFMESRYPTNEALQTAIEQKGSDTLKSVIQQHSEAME